MGWFRSRPRLGACLALFALALNLVLSFGHLHWGGAHDSHEISVVQQALSPSSDHSDTDHDHDHDHHGLPHPCFVCAVAMAAPFAATPPDLPRHEPAAIGHLTVRLGLALHDRRRAAFRSRAPPSA
ncbi:DUF2946 family protein [Afipia sp. P52-10]|jgi:hypothetical protein|uniref:DUF2946 family protein n=1 Tax=Afipia sp. P52-10 TaxID=1429916 RepID=UPI0004B2874C|nr:DUF2946 family protein [Afipia sp. P52-10]